jgi:uncharacterized Zn-finger protein
MANVKSRVNAPKSTSKKGQTPSKNAPPIINNTVESVTVMKRPSAVKLMTPEEKVELLLRHGHLMKDKFKIKPPRRNVKVPKESLPVSHNFLMSKGGKIRKKRMDSIRYFDNILKNELMIDDSVARSQTPKKKSPKVTNNNDIDLSDQNIEKSTPLLESSSEKVTKQVQKKDKKQPKIIVKPVKRRSKSNTKDESTEPAAKFECDHCYKVFTAKSSIRRHIIGHLNLKPHKCPHCTKKFQYVLSMQEHILTQHNEYEEALSNYECHICDKSFRCKETFNIHLADHINNQDSFKCLYCDQKYAQYFMLTQHEKKHLVKGRYQCPVCSVTFRSRELITDHLKSHLKIKEFMCQYCGKEFLRLNSMHRHVQVCHAGHRIQCPICKKKLKGHLTEHMRTHDKKRPHKCPDCGQCFTQSTQLNVHRRSHTGARPYPCRICNRNFSHSNALMLHIRRHTGEKPFPCAMCPITFSQLPHMKAHMRNIHGKENAYKCKKCNMFFKLKADLEKHMLNCTVGDRELSFEEQLQASVNIEEVEFASPMSLSRMRYLLALLLTMIASKDKLKYLGA